VEFVVVDAQAVAQGRSHYPLEGGDQHDYHVDRQPVVDLPEKEHEKPGEKPDAQDGDGVGKNKPQHNGHQDDEKIIGVLYCVSSFHL